MVNSLLCRTATLALLVCVVALSACAATPRSESTGQYIDDTVITTRVKSALFEDPALNAAEINVETFKGQVQLSGFVSSNTTINRAVLVARSVDGVASVTNRMQLK